VLVPRRAVPSGWPLLRGLLPVRRGEVAGDVLAGLTLAALAIPQALGYARIAGMPVVTGLYTLLIPMAMFAVLGSSRHLVVAADSAAAAILAGALVSLAAPGSARYVQLAGLAALLTGGLLLLARLARLGFLANFLSRTVLAGFLTGVGIQVAAGQLPAMLGVTTAGTRSLSGLAGTVAALPRAHLGTAAVSVAVILVMLTARKITRRVPGALIAVIGAIIVSHAADLARHGVAVIGPVHPGLPPLSPPALGWPEATGLVGPAAWLFVVILGQSAATAHRYAARHDETVSTDTDLVGLGAANVAAAFSGAFVVNGSPTQTQMVDSAGGRSQLAQLTTGVVVLLVLLFVTGPLAYLPAAALAAVVFVIGAELVNITEMRRILSVRRDEFTIALLAAAAVVALGVQDGIVVAVIASIIGHLRYTYHPRNSVLVKSSAGHWRAVPVRPGARTEQGLVVYRFGASLYYANASRLQEDVSALTGLGGPLRWMVLDGAAIGDVDYTAASVLGRVVTQLNQQGIRLILASLLPAVRGQLDRYGISAAIGPGAYYDTPGQALEEFRAAGATRTTHVGEVRKRS
jgi:high affinity sulfate transporter 1